MTRSYLEILFRHKVLVLAPVLVAFLLGTTFAFLQPRQYSAEASLWVDTAVTNESTIGTSGGEEPPSTGQAALFSELVGTRGFLLDVVEDSPLRESFEGLSDQQVDRRLTALRALITSTTAGPHIFKIAVDQKSPEDAKTLTRVMVDHFLEDQDELLRRRAETQTRFLKTQLDAAEQAVADASDTGIAPSALADAVLQTAQQQRLEAQQDYERALAATAAIGNEGVLYVRDAPDSAVRQSRLKTLILGAGGGLFAGLTVAAITLVVLMARQRSVSTESELEALLGLNVIGTIDEYDRSPRPMSTAPSSRDDLEPGSRRT